MAQIETREDILALGNIDPELKAIIDGMGGAVPPRTGDIQDIRKMLASVAQPRTAPPEGVAEEEFTIPARDEHLIECRAHYPSQISPQGHPLVLVFYGGGFALGSMAQDEPLCRKLVRSHSVVCVQCNYRHAPEYPFPTPVNDCWDFVKWAAAAARAPNGKLFDLGAMPSDKGFVLVGTSAGANMVDVCLHLARDEELVPRITGAIEMAPYVIGPSAVPDKYKDQYLSREQTKDAPVFQPSTLDWLHTMYKPDDNSPLFNSFANPRGHAGLPPIYFQVCGLDPLRDDGLIYEKALRTEHGIKTKIDIYPGWPHGFWAMFPGTPAEKVAQHESDTLNGLAWLLDLSKSQ